MARNSEENKRPDVEELRDKINTLLREYNCVIETDDYHSAWLRDKDTGETVGFGRGA